MRCHILTAVWGPWHTDRFINLNLPSLLAAKNLPAFAQDIETTYIIATSRSDDLIIRESRAYKLLNQIMRTRIVTYRDSAFKAPIETHKRIWLRGLRSATRARSFYILNPADIVWADGSFKTLAQHISAGKKAIYAMFGRVLDETLTPEALALRSQDGTIAIPPRAMIEMMLRHLHPLNAAYLRDSDQFPFHSEFVFWPVPGEGLLMRSLAALVLGFDPGEYKANEEFLLGSIKNFDDLAFIDDSDDLCGVSLTPLAKDQNWYSTFRRLDIDEAAAWWLAFDDPAFFPLARTRFHFHTSGTRSATWQRVRCMSDFFALQTLVSREIIRIGRHLKDNGCTVAAEIVATALYAARLRRHWRWPAPVSIIVPSDRALAPIRQQIVEKLLTAGKENQLRNFILDHLVLGRLSPLTTRQADSAVAFETRGEVATISGRVLSIREGLEGLTVGGQRVVRSIELPQQNQLLIVDGLLPSLVLY